MQDEDTRSEVKDSFTKAFAAPTRVIVVGNIGVIGCLDYILLHLFICLAVLKLTSWYLSHC